MVWFTRFADAYTCSQYINSTSLAHPLQVVSNTCRLGSGRNILYRLSSSPGEPFHPSGTKDTHSRAEASPALSATAVQRPQEGRRSLPSVTLARALQHILTRVARFYVFRISCGK